MVDADWQLPEGIHKIIIITMMICRSVKPYKMSNCVGGGRNADSCTAIKTKPRSAIIIMAIIISKSIIISLLQSCALCVR